MGVCHGDYGLTGLVVWSLDGCGLMPRSHGMGLAWWCIGGGVGVCHGLMNGGVRWGEWFVHERPNLDFKSCTENSL